VTAAEERELRALVYQAFELRESGYLVDAVADIIEWFERRPLAELEQRQERQARLVRLLRETDPDRLGRAA
jgi:hypothetical protein